jgi:DNA-directed RNA polymerase specialized sigma24 family protein
MSARHGIPVQALHDAIERLEPSKRAVLHLRFWEDMEISMIARIKGVEWADADHLINSALMELRQALSSRQPQQRLTQQIYKGA